MMQVTLAVSAFVLVLQCLTTTAYSRPSAKRAPVWDITNFQSFVTFGDSYTDENRILYFVANNGSAPPPGTLLPENFAAASGGRAWSRYVVQYAGSLLQEQWLPRLTLYNYAVAGAVCSNEITPRYESSIYAPFPSVVDYEIPAFLADQNAFRVNTTEPFFSPSLTGSSAVYAMWIGTNDLGVNAFLTGSQVRGKVIPDYIDCVFSAFDSLYAAGGRVFVLMNTVPLDEAPLYANATQGGLVASKFWPDKPENRTGISETMHEYTTTSNAIFQYKTPFESLITRRYPGASFALFDVWRLFGDIYINPTEYLNGSQPLNTTGHIHHCDLEGSNCEDMYNGTSGDSFMWYDELHPSEQTSRIIARTFVDVLNGNSPYAQYY